MTKNLNLLKLTAILLFVVVLSIQTALPVTANGPIPFLEEFTGFIGSGFDPNPGVGQLDSDIWSITGLSDGDLLFGDSQTTGDFARGASAGGVTTGGVYAFDVGGNTIFGVQPGGTDFTPGEITLRLQNNTGSTITQLDVLYDIWYRNDQPRANSLNFSYSPDNVTYTSVPALDFTTPEVADASPVWQSTSPSTMLTGLNLANGDSFYLKWTGDDVSGSGNRDEYGLDNVQVAVSGGDVPPSIANTTPGNGATGIPIDSNIEINFSEDITLTGSWFEITCTVSGPHTATVGGGGQNYTLDPDLDFANGETCTVTILAAQVSDQDTDDPPDAMSADYPFSFTTIAVASGWVINEILADPDSANGDANGDSIVNTIQDEFIEIVNNTGNTANISGWELSDGVGVKHTFSADSVVADQCSIVVFAGGSPAGKFGGATVQTASSGGLGLNNSGDTVTLNDGIIDQVIYTYGGEGGDNQSLTRDPDITGPDPLIKHSVASGSNGALFSPGTRVDGSLFDGCSIPASIQEIQFTTDPAGNSPYAGLKVTTEGVVTAIFADGVFIQDGSGPWSGLYLYKPDGSPSIGDRVQVTGNVQEYYSLTEIAFGGTVTVLSSGNELPTPDLLSSGVVSDEQWESVLVRVESVEVTNDNLGYGEWEVDDGSGGVRVDDLGSYGYIPQTGDLLDFVQGPLNYTFDDFKIEPRYNDDIGSVTSPGGACGDAFVPIYDIQGSGPASPLDGSDVSVEGVVTGDFQGDDELKGFYIQDSVGDGDPATSDGIFVFAPGSPDVSVGDNVRVAGRVVEYNNLTEISNVGVVLVCQVGGEILPTSVDLPADLEPYEGMLVTFPEELTASQNYFQGRYGQVTLSSEGRLFNPTNIYLPGSAEAIALAAENLQRMLVLDDGTTAQNPNPIPYIGADNTLRAGDTVTGLTGVVDYGLISSDPISHYRLQPTQPVNFTRVNERTTAPEEVGGRVKVASFNVLNYFNGDGLGGGFPTSRGASTAEEFTRQRVKIIGAIVAMDADVIGLMEIENDGYGPTSAIQDLVNGLNDAVGAGTYAFIDPGVAQIGADEIAVGLIYKPGKVMPLGPTAILDSSVDPLFDSTRNRPAPAQTFAENATGQKFIVVVNHLKSKGSSCDDIGDPDTGDGQGNCNLTRTRAALALTNWLVTDPTGSNDPDFIIIGDLNSYAMEDPITTIEVAGYTNLIKEFVGTWAYSYVFDGQAGYLDHALASPTLTEQVTGTTEWHINTDEPSVIDYNTEFKPQDLYTPTPYRASDHDPVIVGLKLVPQCNGANATIYVDENGKIVGGPRNGRFYKGFLLGTHNDDVIVGTDGKDRVFGFKGDDVICGSGGKDLLFGGRGHDFLFGGNDRDILKGEWGNDSLDGGDGRDLCHGGPGADTAALCEIKVGIP